MQAAGNRWNKLPSVTIWNLINRMSTQHEIEFENDICAHLVADGWLYESTEDANQYDRALALYSAEVMIWVQSNQQKTWKWLKEKPRVLTNYT